VVNLCRVGLVTHRVPIESFVPFGHAPPHWAFHDAIWGQTRSDSRCAAEVAIDLEWGMKVQQIWGCAASEKFHEMFTGFLAVAKAGVHVDDPGAAPPCVAAAVCQASFKGHTGCSSEFRGAAESDLPAWMQREEVRDMPVSGLGLVVILSSTP
jgi:hypothetical protein